MRLRICVYSIALNESAHVVRFCEAARDADMIFVADTGSTDNTVQLLEDCGAHVTHISIKPWRFDDARNACLALLREDFDVCVSLDLDEVLQPGWREEIERVWVPGTTRLRYGFDWGLGIAFKYDKCHARHGFRWTMSCHEVVVADRTENVWAETDMVMVVHKPDPTKSRGQYLDILRISIEENPTEPRNAFYYARELGFAGKWQESIDQAKRYLALPRADWANERAYACRVISKAHQELGQWEDAISWARKGTVEAPYTREPWYDVALIAYRMSRWPESFGAAMTCLSIQNKEKVYTMDPGVWGAAPHDLASVAAWNMGLHDVALEHAEKACALDPDEFRLRENLKFIRDALAKRSEAA
jgi:glycosyltransferase involved in cell wall biosynthesis